MNADDSATRVLVAIVNFRTGPLVVNCLRSLAPQVAAAAVATQVIVVDNCSGDGSADLIDRAIVSEAWGGWARVDRAPINGGFSYGNNRAVEVARALGSAPDLVWLLNPDIEVRPGALQHLLDFLVAHPTVGIVGSSTELSTGETWPHAFRFPSIWSEIASALRLDIVGRLLARHVVLLTMGSEPARVDWLPGASMMIRRVVFDQIGPMDEGFFLYFEETDFCLRAAQAGWHCWYVPASRVMHLVGQSSGITSTDALTRRRPRYWFESRRRYWIKHHGWPYAAITDLAWMVCFSLWQLRRVLQRRPRIDPPYLLWDFLRHSALLHTSMPGNRMLAALRA